MAEPLCERIEHVNRLHRSGARIIIFTARGSTTGIDWTSKTLEQLASWRVMYHELILGKPFADVYVDDRAFNVVDYEWGLK